MTPETGNSFRFFRSLDAPQLRPSTDPLEHDFNPAQSLFNLQTMFNVPTCPSCHQTITEWPQSCAFVGRDSEVASMNINHEIHRVDQQIAQLMQYKTTLLRNLNAVQSPIMRLPTETLCSIFKLACPPPDISSLHVLGYYSNKSGEPPDDECFQFALGAVSSHWHQVVQSSPHLWKWVELWITPTNAEKKGALLRLFIENSKKVPFNLALNIALTMSNMRNPSSLFTSRSTICSLKRYLG